MGKASKELSSNVHDIHTEIIKELSSNVHDIHTEIIKEYAIEQDDQDTWYNYDDDIQDIVFNVHREVHNYSKNNAYHLCEFLDIEDTSSYINWLLQYLSNS